MNKSAEAFRTISEVAEWLGVQTHVLRFWESKFTQVKPVKRAGGRRYFRPADMLLLGGIRKLLHDDGMTIKGVQKILREEGIARVADLSPALDQGTLDGLGPKATPAAPRHSSGPDPETGSTPPSVARSFADLDRRAGNSPAETGEDVPEPSLSASASKTEPSFSEQPAPEIAPESHSETSREQFSYLGHRTNDAEPEPLEPETESRPAPEPKAAEPDLATPPPVPAFERDHTPQAVQEAFEAQPADETDSSDAQESTGQPQYTSFDAPPAPSEPAAESGAREDQADADAAEGLNRLSLSDTPSDTEIGEPEHGPSPAAAVQGEPTEDATPPEETPANADAAAQAEQTTLDEGGIPSFLAQSTPVGADLTADSARSAAEPEPTLAPAIPLVDAPDPPPEAEITAAPGALSALAMPQDVNAETRAQLAPLAKRLTALRDRMAAAR